VGSEPKGGVGVFRFVATVLQAVTLERFCAQLSGHMRLKSLPLSSFHWMQLNPGSRVGALV
jgi:hypothetical protein